MASAVLLRGGSFLNMTMRNYLLLTAAIAVSAIVTAQQPVPVGSGSYAEYTPLSSPQRRDIA